MQYRGNETRGSSSLLRRCPLNQRQGVGTDTVWRCRLVKDIKYGLQRDVKWTIDTYIVLYKGADFGENDTIECRARASKTAATKGMTYSSWESTT